MLQKPDVKVSNDNKKTRSNSNSRPRKLLYVCVNANKWKCFKSGCPKSSPSPIYIYIYITCHIGFHQVPMAGCFLNNTRPQKNQRGETRHGAPVIANEATEIEQYSTNMMQSSLGNLQCASQRALEREHFCFFFCPDILCQARREHLIPSALKARARRASLEARRDI